MPAEIEGVGPVRPVAVPKGRRKTATLDPDGDNRIMNPSPNGPAARPFAASFLVLSALALLPGCQPRGTALNLKRPARIDLPGVHRVAVVDFQPGNSNEKSQQAAALLKQSLIQLIQKEGALEVMDLRTAQEAGARADAIITGKVWGELDTDHPGAETALKSNDVLGGLLGGGGGSSRDYVEYIPYNAVRGFLKGQLTLIRFKEGKEETLAVLTAGSGVRQKQGGLNQMTFFDLFNTRPAASAPIAGGPEGILPALANRVAVEFTALVSPHTEKVAVGIAENGDSRALDLIRRGRFSDAIKLLEPRLPAGRDTKSQGPDLYNLGLAYEGLGTVDGLLAARDTYKRGVMVEGENPIHAEGLGRAEMLLREHQRLQRQMRTNG